MGRGGSRWNAGRKPKKVKAETLPNISISAMQRSGLFDEPCTAYFQIASSLGQHGTLEVTATGEDTIDIGWTLRHRGLTIDGLQSLNISKTDCHFGGGRPWFQCPRCNRRKGILYLRLNSFACRLCQQVTYKTQSRDVCDRAWMKQRSIERSLGEENKKPKSMRWTTYFKKLSEIAKCSHRRDLWLVGAFNRLKRY